MRSFLIFSCCAFILVFVGFQTAFGIDLTRYKYPVSTSQEAFLNGTFNVNGTSADTMQTGYNFGGTASYDLFYRSLPFSYQINAVGGFSLSQDITEGAESQSAYSTRLTTRANRYFRETSRLFGFGAATFDYRKLATQDEANDPYVDVTAGAGYGRTIDATVLKQAIRMVEDFKRFQVIKGEVPDEALLELARVIDRKSEFKSQYGAVEYRKYWYAAMEEVLRKAGVLVGDELGAMGIIRIQEVLDEPTGLRFYGWEVRAGAGMVLSDYDGEAGDPLLTVEFDWSRPVSLQLQLNNTSYMSTVFEDDQSYRVGDVFQIYYEITNRIDWDNTLRAEYLIPTAEGVENVLALTFSSTYILYIENRLTFNPSFVFNYRDDGIDDPRSDWAILGSISYRLK
ncbi:MAG: hypothetical protein V1784_04505 [bacterium]